MTQEEARKSIDPALWDKHQAAFPAYAGNAQAFATASGSAVDRTWVELTGKIPN